MGFQRIRSALFFITLVDSVVGVSFLNVEHEDFSLLPCDGKCEFTVGAEGVPEDVLGEGNEGSEDINENESYQV